MGINTKEFRLICQIQDNKEVVGWHQVNTGSQSQSFDDHVCHVQWPMYKDWVSLKLMSKSVSSPLDDQKTESWVPFFLCACKWPSDEFHWLFYK